MCLCQAPCSPGTPAPGTGGSLPCCSAVAAETGRDVWPVGAACVVLHSVPAPAPPGQWEATVPSAPARAGAAERRVRGLWLVLSRASSAVCWFDASRQLLAAHSAAETRREVRGGAEGPRRGDMGRPGCVWVHGLGRFDLSFLTELGPQERARPCPVSWNGPDTVEVAFPSWPEGCQTARGLQALSLYCSGYLVQIFFNQ